MKEALYRACPITRSRRTKAEIDEIRNAIVDVLQADHPMTVRQVFYRLVVGNMIEKTEEQYQGTVIRLLTEMRMTVPFHSIGSLMRAVVAGKIKPITTLRMRPGILRNSISAAHFVLVPTMSKFGRKKKRWLASSKAWPKIMMCQSLSQKACHPLLNSMGLLANELDALPPDELRDLVRACIERHINDHELSVLRAAEESERELLETWADRVEDEAAP